MELKEFKEIVVEKFCATITDKVFLMIQNDRELMRDYLDIISKNNSVANVNGQIAKEIKKRFNLENKDLRNNNPESFLIQSHEEFKVD